MEHADTLIETAQKMVAEGQGILAADGSHSTMKDRLNSISVESTEENRRSYRGMLFTTDGIGEYLSGTILFDETIRQKTNDGKPFPQVLKDQNVIPGIKVDEGKHPLPFSPQEKVTVGLDNLRERLQEYKKIGAEFAKARSVISVSDNLPTNYAIEVNAHYQARYAALCQEAGLVPIVEPEVYMTGTHSIEAHAEASRRTLKKVFDELYKQRVMLEGIVLKPSMIAPGLDAEDQLTDEKIARKTIEVFRQVVPAAVPGAAFLSGGQSPQQATNRLNAINNQGEQPWELTFSFGRALQGPVLEAWQGDMSNKKQAQKKLHERAKINSQAREGEL